MQLVDGRSVGSSWLRHCLSENPARKGCHFLELIPRTVEGTKKTHQKGKHRSPGTGPYWLGELADLCENVMTIVLPRWQGGQSGGPCR